MFSTEGVRDKNSRILNRMHCSSYSRPPCRLIWRYRPARKRQKLIQKRTSAFRICVAIDIRRLHASSTARTKRASGMVLRSVFPSSFYAIRQKANRHVRKVARRPVFNWTAQYFDTLSGIKMIVMLAMHVSIVQYFVSQTLALPMSGIFERVIWQLYMYIHSSQRFI